MIIFGAFTAYPKELRWGRRVLSDIDDVVSEPERAYATLASVKMRRYGTSLEEVKKNLDDKLIKNYPNCILSDIEVETDNPVIIEAIKKCKTVEEIEKILLLI